jgi:hypothetical protein
MPRRLVLLNAVLVAVGLLSIGYVIRELRAPAPPRTARPAPPAPPAVAPAPASPEAQPGGYAVVASRNLFSPTRSEAPVSPTASGPAGPKPNLYGIILRDGAPVAYLEDPTTKRVAGYRLGDTVAGATVKGIANDHVVLNRPEGDLNVRLRDPSKPRPPAPPPGVQPGTPPTPAAPPSMAPIAPPMVTPGGPPMIAPQPPQQPGQAITPVPGQPPVVPRRPLPPNLLRRLPPSASDAPAQQ